MATLPKLKLLPADQYRGVNEDDPIRYYYWPYFGHLYRRRVELCLAECKGGESILEIGFGTGLTFLNLADSYREIHGLDLTAKVDEVKAVFEPRGIQTFLKNGDVLSMPYQDNSFDTVLLISILEHLQPEQQDQAFTEIRRVLKPGGQLVYGVPVERPLMVFMFKMLGYDIRKAHFSTERDISAAAERAFGPGKVVQMRSKPPVFGAVYEVRHYVKG